MMISGPAPTFAATAALGRMSSQFSASTRTLTPVSSLNFLVLATKLSNSAWMNCFQRKTRIEAFGSGAGPFQVGSANALRLTTRPAPAAAAPDISFRLEISLMRFLLDAPRRRTLQPLP